MSSTDQHKLKEHLQGESDASKLEHLAAALFGRLLSVPVVVSKSGFQHGGDAGAAGLHGRRFRIECKKYSDSTSLSDRELLGEIDHALARDDALEGWFLVATREVPEQLVQDLVQKGERVGVPVLIIDWREQGLAPLAALCAFAPDLVETIFSPEAAAFARAIAPAAAGAIETLRRQLQSWCLGFESLRAQSHDKLLGIWNNARTSTAELGQNAAGGAQQHRIRRQSVHRLLAEWWGGPAKADAPAVVVGRDGVGKTWAVLDWLVDTRADLPIILVVPSSAAVGLSGISETAMISFIGQRLYEMTRVRNSDHWARRFEYLLKRPREEGPVVTILFDGMNQEPSIEWLRVLKVLQGSLFEGRIRFVGSTRTHHFENKLSRLAGLIVPASMVQVDIYDVMPGGELDQMLAFESLTRDDLHSDLADLARTPRLFSLVIRFRDRLVEAGQVTVHRLLWEYGRDTLGVRANGKSFSDDEWREWLREIAKQHRDGIKQFTLKSLAETVDQPYLSNSEVDARLSDIVDGRFANRGASGSMQLSPIVVAHALGLALLVHLDEREFASFGAAEGEIASWIDPISGFDQRAEILRAAVSITIERSSTLPFFAGALVTAWLQTQNIADSHRKEIASLAVHIPGPLLDAVEQSDGHAHASARLWAVKALRAIPRKEGPAFETIVDRTRAWLSVVSRGVNAHHNADPKIEQHRKERYLRKIGVDVSGAMSVLSVPLQLVDHSDGELQAIVPLILEGFPLVKAMPCFEAGVVAHAVDERSRSWRGLHWLCQLNETDPDDMIRALRKLSEEMHRRTPEPGIHPHLAARAAALLLWLSGDEADDERAWQINPDLDHPISYERDYLENPSRSWFELERRHADLALNDAELNIVRRIERTGEFWFDPAFEPPAGFVDELRRAAAVFPVDKLHAQAFFTHEQHLLESLSLPLAHSAPEALGDLTRRELQDFALRAPEARYWSAIHSTEIFVSAREKEVVAAGALRRSARDPDENQEAFGGGRLLMLEIRDLDTLEQYNRVIEAGLKFISTDFTLVLQVPTQQEVDALVARWRHGTKAQQHDLVILISVHPIAFSDATWSWLAGLAAEETHELKGVLFRLLCVSDEARFGHALLADQWSWDPAFHVWVNHYGTGALINAGHAMPFAQLAPKLAPWRLLESARRRGAVPAEVRLAADILSQVFAAPKLEAPDPGSDLSVKRSKTEPIFIFSVEPRASPEDAHNPLASFGADRDARIKAYERASETALERINAARRSGASLYLSDIAVVDLELAFHHAPDLVDQWLEGFQAPTGDFVRRVQLAEGPYLALCEVLLKHDPARGVVLWRVLRSVLRIRHVGAGDVDETLHMVFRAPDSPSVAALREELLSLEHCSSDKTLYSIALATSYNGNAAWLKSMIEKDLGSPLAWRRKRGVVLSGYVCNNVLPVPEAWPAGKPKSSHAHLTVTAARFRYHEACARHWWRQYLAAPDQDKACGAWTLFTRSTDHRARVWMPEEVKSHAEETSLFKLKRAHARLNRSNLRNSMKKRIEKLDKKFLGEDIVKGIGPWARL